MEKQKHTNAFNYYMTYLERRAWDSKLDNDNSIQVLPFTAYVVSAGGLMSLNLIFLMYKQFYESKVEFYEN